MTQRGTQRHRPYSLQLRIEATLPNNLMKTMLVQTMTVRSVSRLQTTRNGNMFVECETTKGTVAVWGSPVNRSNLDTLLRATVPFKLSASGRPPSAAFSQRHTWWIPEGSQIQFGDGEAVPAAHVENAPKPRIEPVTVDELGQLRRELIAILNTRDSENTNTAGEGIAARIGRMSHSGLIPRHIVSLMRTITEMRNAAEYQGMELSASESAAVLAAWKAVLEWSRQPPLPAQET